MTNPPLNVNNPVGHSYQIAEKGETISRVQTNLGYLNEILESNIILGNIHPDIDRDKLFKVVSNITGGKNWNKNQQLYLEIGYYRGNLLTNNHYFLRIANGRDLLVINNGNYTVIELKGKRNKEVLHYNDVTPLFVHKCVIVGDIRMNIQSTVETKFDLISEEFSTTQKQNRVS